MGVKAAIRDGQLLSYLLGGGTCIYAIALLGSCAYNAMWDDDNFWRTYHPGVLGTVHSLAVAIIVLAIVSLILVVIALSLRVGYPQRRSARFACYIFSFVVGLAVMCVQAAALDVTTYGDYHVSSQWDYYNSSSEFKEYYDKFGAPDFSTFGSLAEPVHPELAEMLLDRNFSAPRYADLDWSDYFVEYANTSTTPPNNSARVAPCALNWAAIAAVPLRFLGGDPCMFEFTDTDVLGCIGGWSAQNFQRFWCYASRVKQDQDEFEEENKDFSARQKRSVTKQVSWSSVDSLSAFYRHNTYLIGMLVASLIVSVVTVVLDHLLLAPKPPPAPDAVVPA
jgi:hypothetical protein